jgi:hypothetical protein
LYAAWAFLPDNARPLALAGVLWLRHVREVTSKNHLTRGKIRVAYHKMGEGYTGSMGQQVASGFQ